MSEKIDPNWPKIIDGYINVPDELEPLLDKLSTQFYFCTISGKNETLTLCDMVEISRKFFKENRHLLDL